MINAVSVVVKKIVSSNYSGGNSVFLMPSFFIVKFNVGSK